MSDESQNWTTEQFVHNWFDALSEHEPIEKILSFVTNDDLEMVFPERTLHSEADVRDWYIGVGESFSDQSHTVENVVRTDAGSTANLTVTVVWRAKQTSDGTQLAARAHQSWQLIPGPAPQGLLIQHYRVEGLDPI